VRDIDLVIVGAGIVGLAHALAAARRGLKAVVVERDAQANGASIRNFGFVTVTGQQAGKSWRRARRSRDVWAEIAPQAGIDIEHRGLVLTARRPEAAAVLDAFLTSETGEGCEVLAEHTARERFPFLSGRFLSALWSPHDIRVESRRALPLLAKYLEREHGVEIRNNTSVLEIAPPEILTSRGKLRASAIVVATGDAFNSLYAERLEQYGLTRCKLQMLRVRGDGGRLPCSVMSDLSLTRYLGYSDLPEAAAIRDRLAAEQPEFLGNGIHLIVVGSADGSRIVGDSHHYAQTPDPFSSDAVDALILAEYEAVFGERPQVIERWSGTDSRAPDRPMIRDAPEDRVRVVVVTSGKGASTAFAIAEETIEELFP
jgi:FAD dependent oxidoreductase TIGR03364